MSTSFTPPPPPPPSMDTSPPASTTTTIIIITITSAVVAFVCLYLLFRFLFDRLRRSTTRTFSISNDRHGSSDSNNHRHVSSRDVKLLDSLPLFTFSSVPNLAEGDCAVCLSKFRKRDRLRLLPLCCHAFHAPCIDAWIVSNQTCPLCRSPVFDTPDKIPSPAVNTTVPRVGSFRLEIGSVSHREGGGAAVGGSHNQRSYAIGDSMEYVVDVQNGYEVLPESSSTSNARHKEPVQVAAPPQETVLTAAEFSSSGRNWLMEYLSVVPNFYRTVSLRSSGRFFSGSMRRGNTSAAAAAEDLEANRVGEEISEMFRWFSGF